MESNTNNDGIPITQTTTQTTTQTITKKTIKRLIHDIKTLIESPLDDNGVYYTHDDDNMLLGYALIIGQKNTPYFGGFYFFKLIFPPDYPFTPPNVKFCITNGRTRFNPNLYQNGKVCLSILNTWHGEQWSACQTIKSVLLSLTSMVLINDPLLNEPGNNPEIQDYNKIIEYENISTAVCDVVMEKRAVYPIVFDIFRPQIKDHFKKNYKYIYNFINKQKRLKTNNTYIKVKLYNLLTYLDYDNLQQKMILAKKYIES